MSEEENTKGFKLANDANDTQLQLGDTLKEFGSRLRIIASERGQQLSSAVKKSVSTQIDKIKSIPKNIGRSILGNMPPIVGAALSGVGSIAGGVVSDARALFGRDKQQEPEPSLSSSTPTTSSIETSENIKIEKHDDQLESLEIIAENAESTNVNVKSILKFLRGNRLEEYELEREQTLRDEKMLAALLGTKEEMSSSTANANANLESSRSGLAGIFDSFKRNILEIIGSFAVLKAAFSKFKNILRGARTNLGKFAQALGRIRLPGTPPVTAPPGPERTRGSVRGGGGFAATASAAGGVASSARAVSKYPKLAKMGALIRRVPMLAPLSAGIETILAVSDDEMSPREKQTELARIIGAYGTGAAGAKLGAILGSFGGPIGALGGAVTGGVLGYIGGGDIAERLAASLLERPTPPLTIGETISPDILNTDNVNVSPSTPVLGAPPSMMAAGGPAILSSPNLFGNLLQNMDDNLRAFRGREGQGSGAGVNVIGSGNQTINQNSSSNVVMPLHSPHSRVESAQDVYGSQAY